MTYVYFIQQARGGSIKIGVSDDPHARKAGMQTGTSKQLRVIAKFPMPNRATAFQLEKELHAKFAHLRTTGEWFHPRIIREMRFPDGRRVIGGTYKNPLSVEARECMDG